MTVILETDKEAIKKFVQGVLGCTCPDEVFLNIKLEKNPSNFSDISRGDMISIGGVLLVFLIKPNDGEDLAGKLGRLFNRGQETRDKGGFNRFRLVVLTSRILPTREMLARQFEALEGLDGRLHLHVIETEQLPDLIAR